MFNSKHGVIRPKELANIRGLSMTTLHKEISLGIFIKPISLGERAKGYPLKEVNAVLAFRNRGASKQEMKDFVEMIHAKRAAEQDEAISALFG